MADIDVAVKSLTAPPALATITAYRPAVLVENLGLAAAVASGELRIYNPATGLLIFSAALTAVSIPLAGSRNVYAATYWTPPGTGTFLVTAQVTCPGDQVPANGILAPTAILVSAEPPPPPPTVPEHASQHENGGEDELSLDGLGGQAAEPQRPTDHGPNHESGGIDEMDVTDLHGVLADAQPIALHAASHMTGGSDPVSGIEPEPHHETHEPGGGDEIEGIPAAAHHESHEPGGDDVIAAAAPLAHHSSHALEGTDEISVQGLSGVLAEPQAPTYHAAAHAAGGADVLTAAALIKPHFGIGYQQISNPLPLNEWTVIGEHTINFSAPIFDALLLSTILIGTDPQPNFVCNGSLRFRVNGEFNPPYNFQYQFDHQDFWTLNPVTLASLMHLDVAAQSWILQVEIFVTSGNTTQIVSSLMAIPAQ